MSKKTELRAAAARLMYGDNRDVKDFNMLIDFIESYEERTGEWVHVDRQLGMDIWVCTNCDQRLSVECRKHVEETKYCPTCGYRNKMREKSSYETTLKFREALSINIHSRKVEK